jgi:hypothetical protein
MRSLNENTMDLIDHPPHYTHGDIEPIDFIEAIRAPFHLGNVIKYIARHEHKGTALADLRKARWYLDRYITLIEDTAFDRATSEAERRLCERVDDAFNRVDVPLMEFVLAADGVVERHTPVPGARATFDVVDGEVLEVAR